VLCGIAFRLRPSAPRTCVTGSLPLLPTPMARDGRPDGSPNIPAANGRGTSLMKSLALLPTPAATDYGNNQSPSVGAAVRPSLPSLVKLLPTPNTQLGTGSSSARRTGYRGDPTVLSIAESLSRGASTSPPSAVGKPSTGLRLNPSFVGWMMGTPSCGECGREWTDPDCPHSATAFTSKLDGSPASTSPSLNGGD
jgi:hypothetical protein